MALGCSREEQIRQAGLIQEQGMCSGIRVGTAPGVRGLPQAGCPWPQFCCGQWDVVWSWVDQDSGLLLLVSFLLLFVLSSGRYESVIATLCENLDSLDEPEARAAMIWIVGEYAERIDNADELLESFLEGFHDESTQVCQGTCCLGVTL